MPKISLLLLLLISAVGTIVVLRSVFNTGDFQKMVISAVSKKVTQNTAEANVLQSVLGFDRPRTYLVLFLNNTELRPAGGFIGSYAVINVGQGKPRLIKVEGTEILDNAAPKFVSTPPDALQTYLGIEKWSFRDSNWDPDFARSAVKALELYKKEGGVSASEIEGVVGFTPTVIEEFLRVVGPVQVNGEEFNADNFTEKLEYEVEYGFADHGITFSERKRMLADLTTALLSKIKTDILQYGPAYWKLGERLLKEKQIVAYAPDDAWQKILIAKDWAGEMKQTAGDYLLWTDANLGALKTDVVIKRALHLGISLKDAKYEVQATMKYTHTGKMDWRISRYRTYSRIYVPLGSKIVRVEGKIKNAKGVAGAYDQGEENGRQWFGAFVTVEPGQTGTLAFVYTLSPEIVNQIASGNYNLLVQKQIGVIAPQLTLDLEFGKKLQTTTDLSQDRIFKIESE